MDELKAEKNWQKFTFVDDEAGFAFAKTLYPESQKSGKERANANLTRQVEQTRAQEKLLIADITVSHGFFVDVMGGELGHRYTYLCDYCATTSYKIKLASSGEAQVTLIDASNADYVQT